MIIYPFLKRRKKKSWRFIVGREVELLAWVYIWFYLGWGLNYFRYDIYRRMEDTLAWGRLGVLAVEMESAALYCNAAEAGKRALAVCTVSDNLLTGEALYATEQFQVK